MNSRKSKPKKRKLSDLEESSEHGSSDKEENSDSNSDEESNFESQEESSSDAESVFSVDSQSSSNSNPVPVRRSKAARASHVLSDSSESGDENCEKCAICLRSILRQEVGNPEVCDHIFCSVCIIEWSKNSNVCPLDRQQFSIILIRKNKDGDVVRKVNVEEPLTSRVENVELEPMDDTVCEICGSGDREDIMLLCDVCDRGFHTICLTPPLEDIPDENEWFCPDCEIREPGRDETLAAIGLDDFFDQAPSGFRYLRSLRPRIQMVRTRLLERIRVTVSRIVENYVLQHNDDIESSHSEFFSDDAEDSSFSLGSDLDAASNQPSTSGLQARSVDSKTKKKKVTRKRKTTSRKKKVTGKRKTSSKKKTGASARKRTRRKTRVRTTRTKKVKVENEDGSITEKIVKTRTYKRRRQKRKKRKVKTFGINRKRGLRVKSVITPKTPKGRLALMLGMVPSKKPGQLIPEIKARSSNSTSTMDLDRARAGIPKLHIFGPRNELQYFSSGSDHEDFAENNSGGLATVTQPRTSVSRLRSRQKAALALQSLPLSSTPKSKPVIEPPVSEEVDILGSILSSQAVWHSKNTNSNVKINTDGSIEIIKKDKDKPKPENNEIVDIRDGGTEGAATQAPMYPGSSSRPGGFRPYNRTTYGDSRSGQDNNFPSRGGQSQTGVNFNRFGGSVRNDREGYTNYLNNMPQGPTPFCRGGPPLRFRMPPRQQLRRIQFPPRNRPNWQPEEEEGENEEKDGVKEDKLESEQNQPKEEDDVDLYSDIETNVEKTDNSGAEDGRGVYPALGPPPEPSAFLLGLDENGDFGETLSKNKSEVYDPAEPCDSEDDMVIDENQERTSSSPKQETESKKEAENNASELLTSTSPEKKIEEKSVSQKNASDDEEEDCPIFSIYSSVSREFSQKEEEERGREIAEERKKLEEMKIQENNKFDININHSEEIPVETVHKTLTETEKKGTQSDENSTDSEKEDRRKGKRKEKVGCRLSFDIDLKGEEKDFSVEENSQSPNVKCENIYSENVSEKEEQRSPSLESEKQQKSGSPFSFDDKSSSPDLESNKFKRSKVKVYGSESEEDKEKDKEDEDDKSDEDEDDGGDGNNDDDGDDDDDDDKENEESLPVTKQKGNEEILEERAIDSESETVSQKVATGLEGLDVEEVSSENDEGDAFADKRSLSSLSLSELSNRSKRSRSPIIMKKRKKNKKRKLGKSKAGKNFEEGEIDDSEKDNRLDISFRASKNENEGAVDENGLKTSESRRGRKSNSSDRQVLGSKENKKIGKEKSKDKDLSWKKPSKKDKNYREGKKRSKDRGRSRSVERRKSRSPSLKKDKKKNKDRKKKTDKKKDIERYDVRKIVKNKEIRKTDAFGRDILSKSRSISRSRSRSPVRDRSRNMLRRDSRSFSRSRSRSFRRGRSPVRRRYIRSRTRSRSKSIRRSYSRSKSRSRSRKSKKKIKSKERIKIRSRSRGRKSRSLSRGRRRSLSKSRSRSPVPRVVRSKKGIRSRRSWSHQMSRSPSFSPRRSQSVSLSPIRVKRSYSRSISSSWSRGRSPLPRTSSLEKLTVVLTTKEKKKWKKKKEGKKAKKDEKRKKKTGNSKEVFASGDNVLVSVNFRNSNNTTGNSASMTADCRNTRLNSLSPVLDPEAPRKKRRGSDYETERVTKKTKKSNPISKKVVDVALSNTCPKRAKKLTRLSEKDAEVILNRKPVAVIDLDLSPYREQTPSPINVVVVSDSGSGDEGKENTPQRTILRGTPGREVDKIQEPSGSQSVNASDPRSPLDNGYVPTSGPKTPPEPQIKFSIAKPQQLRQIANPLGDDDDDDDEIEDEAQEQQRVESLDRRPENELDSRTDVSHKGPNTPLAPRGPSTPKTPPSPQTSPDAYDPFEPTKSRSPSPSQDDKENRLSPKTDEKIESISGNAEDEGLVSLISGSDSVDKPKEVILESHDDKVESIEKNDVIPVVDCSLNVVIPARATCAQPSDNAANESPERKITVVITTPQNKAQSATTPKPFNPVLKQLPMASSAGGATLAMSNLTVSTDLFSMPSPTKTSRSITTTTQSLQVTGIQRLQHRLGSPVNRTPSSVKSTPEKRSTPRTETNDILTSGNYKIRNVSKRNGEQTKQPRPLQDATNETIDITMDMDDSPYSPASSEGDDLFDPPVETSKPSQSNSKATSSYKGVTSKRKSPPKQLSKFDLLFGPSLSPLKAGNKKSNLKLGGSKGPIPKPIPPKPQKKGISKKNTLHKMDEDQLRVLDELPSSAVELQVKDKFLKKLNRQERVVDEVKTVLKPHYARKHITKEEYKDILRRSVPKICHSRSGEINPSKIQSLIEAYVKKFRHAKKKGMTTTAKPKTKKTMFS